MKSIKEFAKGVAKGVVVTALLVTMASASIWLFACN